MVTILSVGLIELTGIEQERTTSPFRCTEQAPHCATPHPYFVPVRPTCSRMTQSSGVPASACTSRVVPLMVSFAMLFSSDCPRDEFYTRKRHCRSIPSPLLRDRVGPGVAHGEVH